MAINLLNAVKEQLTDNVMGSVATLIGENKSITSSALDSILPTIIGSVIQRGSTESGAGRLLNIIADGKHNGSIFENFSELLVGADSSSTLMNVGKSLISGFMGTNLNPILDLLGKATGLTKGANSSLMNIVAPVVMSIIGQHVRKNRLNGAGLMDLLKEQSPIVSSLLPAGMGDLLGFSKSTPARAANISTASIPPKKSNDLEPPASGGWIKYLLGGLLLLVALGFFGYKTGCSTVDSAANKVSDVTNGVVETAGDVANVTGSAASQAAEIGKDATGKILDKSGEAISDVATTLGGTANSFSDLLGEYKVGTTYPLSKIEWKTDSPAVVKNYSKEEIKNLGVVLKGNKDLKIEIQVHTNDGGNPMKNKALSDARAAIVTGWIIDEGIVKSQVSAKGMSSDDTAKAAANAIEIFVKK